MDESVVSVASLSYHTQEQKHTQATSIEALAEVPASRPRAVAGDEAVEVLTLVIIPCFLVSRSCETGMEEVAWLEKRLLSLDLLQSCVLETSAGTGDSLCLPKG